MRLTTIATRKALTIAAIATVVAAATCAGCASSTSLTVTRASAADANCRLIQEPDAGYSPIIDLISRAGRSVRMTMYELTDPAAINALIDAHRRGIDTKVILDAAFHGHDTNAEAFQKLSDAGVDVKWAPTGAIWHQKTSTVDDATGSEQGPPVYHGLALWAKASQNDASAFVATAQESIRRRRE